MYSVHIYFTCVCERVYMFALINDSGFSHFEYTPFWIILEVNFLLSEFAPALNSIVGRKKKN